MSMCKHVYVVIANECERVKECFVLADKDTAQSVYRALQDIYGGANVCLASRCIDDMDDGTIARLIRGQIAAAMGKSA